MPLLVRGRIIYPKVAVPDPQGQNPKEGRPFVVISRDEEIERGDPVQAVGITGELHLSPADHYVLLPYGPNAKTGLKQKSAALCTWMIGLSQDKVEVGKGYIRADLVNEIVKKTLQLKSISPSFRDDSDDAS